MTPFLFTVAWDRPLVDVADRFASEQHPADPSWDTPRDPHQPYARPAWTPRIPHTGVATICLVPEAFGLTDVRHAALALVAGLGASTPEGPRLSTQLVEQRGPGMALADAARRGDSNLSGLVFGLGGGPMFPRPATVWVGTEDTPHRLAQDGDTLVGTGALEGRWPLARFFAPPSRGRVFGEPRGANLTDVLSIGAVALAMGVVWGWTETRRFTAVGLGEAPYGDVAQPLIRLVAAVLAKHRFHGPGVVISDARRALLEGNKAHHMARAYQHRTRVATVAGRSEMAHDLVLNLLGELRASGNFVVDQAPCPTHWVLHRTILHVLEGRRPHELGFDMASAFDAGRAMGHEVVPDTNPNTLLLAARARGWV